MGRNYSRKDVPSTSDLSLIWDSANSDWRLTPFSSVANLIGDSLQALKTAVQEPATRYLTPVDGFTFTLEGQEDLHLLITPAGPLTLGTVVLPPSPELRDKQMVLVTTTQEITGVTVGGNGADVVGAPTTLLLGGFFTMKFDMQNNTWYRVR